MEYSCCHCSKAFDVHDAIDGYEHGYKNGFLCPHCNENIDENRESLLKDFVLIGLGLFIAMCGLPGAGSRRMIREVNEPFWEAKIFGIGFSVFFIIVALVKGFFRSKRAIKTKPAHKECT